MKQIRGTTLGFVILEEKSMKKGDLRSLYLLIYRVTLKNYKYKDQL